MANGLARAERLSLADAAWLRTANDHATAAYPDPTTLAPDCYDSHSNPGARAWFKSSATDLLAMTRHYLAMLDRYGVGWVELRTSTPGRVTYEDAVQVVAVPPSYPSDWPL
jgi:hypothetical protein